MQQWTLPWLSAFLIVTLVPARVILYLGKDECRPGLAFALGNLFETDTDGVSEVCRGIVRAVFQAQHR